ncbi:MAG: PP2C family protein-serine/threonine phosphatase [Bacteroidales bacterium]
MTTNPSLSRLEFCNFKLRTLLEFTLAINQNLSTDELLKKYEKLLRWKLNIGKVLIFANNRGWKCILVSGISNDHHFSINVENDLMQYSDITSALAYENPAIKEFDIVLPIIHNSRPLAYVLVGDIDEENDGVSPTIKHMQFVQTLTNIVVVAIENKRLFKDNLEKERIHKEMELASEMQNMLVPDLSKFPGHRKIDVEGFYLPHLEVGGDYYDIFELNAHEVGFCIADVSGKGISAALLMSNFQANLRALFVSSIHLTDVVTILNERVINSVHGEKFITLFIARLDLESNELRYINAGHNAPLLYNKASGETIYLKEGCIGIGMMDTIDTIEEGFISLENDSKILCYTDGLIELDFKDNVGLRLESVEKCFCNTKSIKDTFQEMLEILSIKKSNPFIFDDITLLGLDLWINR